MEYYVLKDLDGKPDKCYVGLDNASGGYPFLTDLVKCEKFNKQEAEKYKELFNARKWILQKLNYSVTNVSEYTEKTKDTSKKNIKQNMLEFIREKHFEVKEIADIKIKQCDDEDGVAGEHYIVDCIKELFNPSGGNIRTKETCLVNRKAFQDYIRNQSSIIWI